MKTFAFLMMILLVAVGIWNCPNPPAMQIGSGNVAEVSQPVSAVPWACISDLKTGDEILHTAKAIGVSAGPANE